MKNLRKLLAGTLLVALTAFGLTALTSSSTDSTRWVAGFTDTSCQSNYFLASSLDELSKQHGKKDSFGNLWKFKAYIWADDPTYECHQFDLDTAEVVVKAPKQPSTGGGGGGGGGKKTPTPQKTPPEKTPSEKKADKFTEEQAKKLKKCWEQKLDRVTEEIKGWNSEAVGATEATWSIVKNATGLLGLTEPSLSKNSTLSMTVQIYPHGIAAWLSPTAHENAFAQLTSYSQMHETFHIGQIKAIVDATGKLPKPYEWWDLEVEAHRGSGKLWQGMYGKYVGTPTLLPLESPGNKSRKAAYDTNAARYKELEKKKKNGTITSTEETEMEGLEKDLKDPNNLPQAETSNWWDPEEIDLDCDWE